MMANLAKSLASVRKAVARARPVAETFHTGTAKFFDANGVSPHTPVLICMVRVKKPKPSSFDAGNQSEWSTKRNTVLKAPLTFPAPYENVKVIKRGLIVQIETPDGDPSINNVTFVVQSAMTGQFAAEREITVTTELNEAPRIATTP